MTLDNHPALKLHTKEIECVQKSDWAIKTQILNAIGADESSARRPPDGGNGTWITKSLIRSVPF